MTRDLSVPRPIDLPAPVPLDTDADLSVLDDAKILAAPDDPADWRAWRAALRRWRKDARRRHAYDGSTYDSGATWASSCHTVGLVWLWDERLHDRATGRFTVEAFLDASERDYGGFDGVVLWHAYPVIGLDPRNQWDFYRDVPDLGDVVAAFHRRGVRVFVDYNPWDVGTRRAAGDDASELARLVADLGADGVFLDTLKEGAPGLVAALARVGRPVALEGESRLPLAAVPDHALSWAQWFADSHAPGVLRAHWYERRHMMHHTRRWNRDHSAELQSAWVNGCGVLVWDDVFGVWVGWNARDRATLRKMRQLQRQFRRHFVDGEWTPLDDPHPAALAAGVFAHRYDHGDSSVWTVVNRGERAYRGPVLRAVDAAADVPARGIACLVRDPFGAVRQVSADGAAQDTTFPARPVAAVHGPQSTPWSARAAGAPDGTVAVPPGRRVLPVRYRRRETGQRDEAPWVDAWKPLPPELHAVVREERRVDVGPAAVDTFEVSNADFARFLAATGYTPAVANRFLAHWRDGAPPPGTENEPVTHVNLDDARAFAAWRGRRLPTPDEWQVAIGRGARRRSPLVWNWTSAEYTDGVSRYALLKGGSWFSASGSDWYVDGGEQAPDWELKLVLPGGGLDRSPCVGFRCAVDLADGSGDGRA